MTHEEGLVHRGVDGDPLALSACGGAGTDGDPGSTGGAAGETIKIASLHPLSGASAADGQQMDNGAKLAVEAINAAGGIKSLGGAKLELVSADSQGKPEVGQSEAQRLIQDGAVGIVGTYQSAVSANVATVAERNKVPFIIDISVADSISTRVTSTPSGCSRARPSSARRVRSTSSTCRRRQDSPSRRSPSSMSRARSAPVCETRSTRRATELGFEVGPAISYDAASVADLTTQVTQVKASGADVLAGLQATTETVCSSPRPWTRSSPNQRRLRRRQRRVRPSAVPQGCRRCR